MGVEVVAVDVVVVVSKEVAFIFLHMAVVYLLAVVLGKRQEEEGKQGGRKEGRCCIKPDLELPAAAHLTNHL